MCRQIVDKIVEVVVGQVRFEVRNVARTREYFTEIAADTESNLLFRISKMT